MAKRKTLGAVQEAIVSHVAENIGYNRNQIREALGKPRNDYRTVYYAVESLEEMGYVVKRDDDSIILTEKGVLYIISKRPRQYVLPILENYSEIYPDFKRYLQLSEELGHKLFLKIANNLFNSHELMDKKADRRKAVSIGLSLASIFSDEFSDEERGKIIKAILKVYPEFNEPFKENMKQLASFWLESDSN